MNIQKVNIYDYFITSLQSSLKQGLKLFVFAWKQRI